MVLYEVIITPNESSRESFMAWLPGHIKRVLRAKGFKKAQVYEEDTLPHKVTVFYQIESKKALDLYFQGYGKEMKEEALEKFSGQFEASRKVHSFIKEFTGED
jgi:quinol monooxygenase YgiN